MANIFGPCKRCTGDATGSYYGGTDGYCNKCREELEAEKNASNLAKAKKLRNGGLRPSDLKILGFSDEIIREIWL